MKDESEVRLVGTRRILFSLPEKRFTLRPGLDADLASDYMRDLWQSSREGKGSRPRRVQ